MATKRDEQAADYRAEAIAAPFADAAERSSTVSKTGEGQSGMRTERITLELPPTPEPSVARVTLEFSGRLRSHPSQWPWDLILSGGCVVSSEPGDFFRVVDEAHFDDLAQVAMERDAAIREREEAQARVAELEAAAKLAPPANDDGGSNHAAQAASGGGYAGDGVVLECDDCGNRFWLDDTSGGSHRMIEPDNAFGGEVWESYCPSCHTQAASGGGEGEPVAWGVIVHRDTAVFCCPFAVKQAADHFVALNGVNERMSVVPLYRVPPQPRGWLTDEERKAVVRAESQLGEEYSHGPSDNEAAAVLRSLLARSSPPEVVLPLVAWWAVTGHALVRRVEVRAALAAAGVAVKEVGRD